MRITKSLLLAAMLTFGAAGAATADGIYDYNAFSTWDTDNDGFLTETEYGVGFDNAGYFDTWDQDDDGLLSDEEFGYASSDWGLDDGIFDIWDADNDSFLDDDELGTGLYGTFDADDNDQLVVTEFDDASDDGWFDW